MTAKVGRPIDPETVAEMKVLRVKQQTAIQMNLVGQLPDDALMLLNVQTRNRLKEIAESYVTPA